MASVPILWEQAARKEVYDLLVELWPQLDDADRTILVAQIVAGPPEKMSMHLPEPDRTQLRDRRIFERLEIMRRSDPDQTHPALEAECLRIRDLHPQWRMPQGDQAHFSFYSQSGWRVLDAANDKDRLQAMTANEIVEVLSADDREEALDAWRDIVASDWARMIAVLEGVANRRGPDPELWAATFWGLRTKAEEQAPGESVLDLVAGIDDTLALNNAVASSAAYLLEAAASSSQFSETSADAFWRAFNKVALGVSGDEGNDRQPNDFDWVSIAINTSMGNLALAYLNALFAMRLHVGQRIPQANAQQLIRLLGEGQIRHRPARIVCASRLSYLFAIDPDFIRAHLLPYFQWGGNDADTTAVWQGFGWQPHIDPLLWTELKPHLLACFEPGRIEQLGETVRPLAQILVAAGLNFGLGELPRDITQGVIRRMDAETRAGMLQWLLGALAREEEEPVDPDAAWTEKIKPWIERFWPRDPQSRSSSETRWWVEIALATNAAFDDATEKVSQFIQPSENDFLLEELARSIHPTTHPRSSLRLMDTFLSRNDANWAYNELRSVLDRVAAADQMLTDDPIYRRWDDFERARA